MERTEIRPNDTVLHKPTGETWVVCGVNHDLKTLIPCGYPFPSIGKIEDCELLQSEYETHPQTVEQINALKKHGMDNYIDVKSAMFHGII